MNMGFVQCPSFDFGHKNTLQTMFTTYVFPNGIMNYRTGDSYFQVRTTRWPLEFVISFSKVYRGIWD
jgi:hypothetical protein